MVPKDIQHLYVTPHITLNQIFPYLKYQIIAMTRDSLKNIYTVTEGFENRLNLTFMKQLIFIILENY